MCIKFKEKFKNNWKPYVGDPVREGEVSLSILLQSWLPLLNHILWKIKLYAMSNLEKLYTIKIIII
jgi:hypothetical protein